MKVATWNVNGIRARQTQVHEWIAAEQPDVICLQELKALPQQIPPELREMVESRYWTFWHGGPKGYSGVSVHLQRDVFPDEPEFFHPSFDFENRMVVAQVRDLHVASVYVPNGGKDFEAKLRFFHALKAYAESLRKEGKRLILCGDLNIARAEMDVHPMERGAFTGQLPQERTLFESLLSSAQLVDVGRALALDNDRLFTWWAPWRNMRARNIGWRLDYILASEELARKVSSCTVATQVGTSDHAPVMAIVNDSSLR